MSKEKVSCRWWQTHRWTKWRVVSRGTTRGGWPVIVQERVCTRCGYISQKVEE